MNKKNALSRQEFLKLSSLTMGGLAMRRWNDRSYAVDFPEASLLARATEERVTLRARPDLNSQEIGYLNGDEVVPWLREVTGYNPYRFNQRWIETPNGYVWSPLMQPVHNEPNAPLDSLRKNTTLGPGMWAQVSIPWVDVTLENSTPFAPSVKNRLEKGLLPRLYYSQVLWVDQIKTDEQGQVWYRIHERYSYGDIFWGRAEAFRPLTYDEVSPISPEGENKRIDVNLARQTLSCFEDEREVFFARVSTGRIGDDSETPVGLGFRIWRKMISAHMSGGTTGGGWDLAGVGFTSLFVGDGIATHSTFWHNNYGERTSRGCINCRPQDAKWIFRWTQPQVGYDPGDVTITDFTGTLIRIFEE